MKNVQGCKHSKVDQESAPVYESHVSNMVMWYGRRTTNGKEAVRVTGTGVVTWVGVGIVASRVFSMLCRVK